MATYTPNLNLIKPEDADFFSRLDQNGNMDIIDGLAVLKGATPPTSSTVGTVGQFYLDTLTGASYQCKSISGGVYTWESESEKIGTIKNYMGSSYTIPGQSWAITNGAEFDATTYPELASVLGASNPATAPWQATQFGDFTFRKIKYVPEFGKYFAIGYPSSVTPNVYYTDDLVTGTWTAIQLSASAYWPLDFIYFKGYLMVLTHYNSAAQIWYSNSPTTSTWSLSTYALSGVGGTSTNIGSLSTDGTYLIANSTGGSFPSFGYCTAVNGAWTLKTPVDNSTYISAIEYDAADSRWVLLTPQSGGNCYAYYASNPSGTWTSAGLIATFQDTGMSANRMKKINGLWVIWAYGTGKYIAYGASLTSPMTSVLRSGYNIFDIVYANDYYVCACDSSYFSSFKDLNSAYIDRQVSPVHNISNVLQEQETHGGRTVLMGAKYRYSLPKYSLPLAAPTVGNNFIRME